MYAPDTELAPLVRLGEKLLFLRSSEYCVSPAFVPNTSNDLEYKYRKYSGIVSRILITCKSNVLAIVT